ncbi:MAG TPA: flavin reductase family protein [Clostridiales bacterium]|nr:flavin reductase family protein [Eubacteriales bacterium]HBR32616.1 flavin reductase family protein [Clostridiales bacterium]
MAKTNWKGGALLSPVPAVLVTSADGEKRNVCTVAWTGILNTNPAKLYISVRPSRYTHELISKTGEFCINLPSSNLVRIVDFCGVKSGREVDKFAVLDINPEKASVISCPVIAECPVAIECKVVEVIQLGSHDMFIADIVAVDVEEHLIDENGRLRLEKAGLFAYSHGSYYILGKKIGSFGFSVKKKNKHANTTRKQNRSEAD